MLKKDGSLFHPSLILRKCLSLFVVMLLSFEILSVNKLNEKAAANDKIYASTIEFLLEREQPEDIRLYVNKNIGGFAGMYGIKYYADSRSELFLPVNNAQGKNYLKEYYDLMKGKLYYKDFFARYNFTHIIVTDAIIVTNKDLGIYDALSRDPDYEVIYERTYTFDDDSNDSDDSDDEEDSDDKSVTCRIFVPKVEE